MKSMTIGLDLAKSVFQVHGVDAAGQVSVKKKLRRPRSSGSSRRFLRPWSAWRLAARRTTGPGRFPPWATRCG